MLDSTGERNDQLATPGWQVESWRLTAFVGPGVQVSEPNWWTDLVGEAPEVRTANPRQGMVQERGPYGGGTLVLAVQPGRVDWVLAAEHAQENMPPETFPSLGSIAESMEAARSVALRWLEVGPPIARLALGGVLFQPADSRHTAYRLITRYVPGLRLDCEDCADFLYQINRPRVSAVHAGLRINRLAKWSAAAHRLMRVELMPTPRTVSESDLSIAARLELDINTSAEFVSELPRSELPVLFEELVELGVEIATRGDIP